MIMKSKISYCIIKIIQNNLKIGNCKSNDFNN